MLAIALPMLALLVIGWSLFPRRLPVRRRRTPSQTVPAVVQQLEDRCLLSAGDLTTVLNWVQARQITANPDAPGYGAVLSHQDPGRYDGPAESAVPVYLEQWYFSDITMSSLLQARIPGSVAAAALYLESRFRFTDPETGAIEDQWFLADGSRPDSVLTRLVDADDSSRAMTLETSWQLWQAGVDESFFLLAGRKQLLEKIADGVIDLQQADGLTWNHDLDNARVKYLADNSEAIAGLRAMAHIERVIYGDELSADGYDAAADRIVAGIQNVLFIGPQFDWARHSPDSSFPDGKREVVSSDFNTTAFIVWPAIFDVIDPVSVQAWRQQSYLNENWDWSNAFVAFNELGQPVPWAAVGYAALRSGDVAHAQAQVNFLISQRFPTLTSNTPAYPFISPDAGWMVRTMSMPYWQGISTLHATEDQELSVSGLAIDSLADVATRMSVSLSVEHGTLSLGSTAGLTFTAGDGVQDAAMTIEGSATAINAALAQLAYGAENDFNGSDQLSLRVTGIGVGRDGGLYDVRSVAIEVAAVNDPPVAQPNANSVSEDGTVSGNVITDNTGAGVDHDVDNLLSSLTVTRINAATFNAGQPIVLSSGALLTIHADGSYIYNPNSQFKTLLEGETASDSFTYTIRDPAGETSTATVTITINGATDPFTIVGPTAYVFGTGEDDVIELRLTDRQVVLNSVVYDLTPGVTDVLIDGLAGNDSFTIHGTEGNDAVRLLPGEAFLEASGDGTTGHAVSVETIVFNGQGGSDLARFFDSTGDDEYTAGPADARMTGAGFNNTAHASANIGYASQGYDVAFLLDSPAADRFLAWNNRAAFMGSGFVIQVFNFDEVTATASLGTDRAVLHDSVGDDLLINTPTAANLSGGSFSNQAEYFDWVLVRSRSGSDTAKLHGAPTNDALTARPGVAVMSAETGTSYNIVVEGFAVLVGYGQGGNDLARFYGGPGTDVYVGRPGIMELSGPGYVLQAYQFSRMYGVGRGANDTAMLFDSTYIDTFTGYGNYGELKGGGSFHRLTGFVGVTIFGNAGGENKLNLYPTNPTGYLLMRRGIWV